MRRASNTNEFDCYAAVIAGPGRYLPSLDAVISQGPVFTCCNTNQEVFKPFMKKAMLTLLVVLAVGALAIAQIPQVSNQTTDILGAHTGYGRGCVMCHAPHSGSAGNGVSNSGDSGGGNIALWGQDLTPLYG